LAVLATCLKQKGFSVCTVDNIFRSPKRWQFLRGLLISDQPLAVGLNTSHLYEAHLIDRIFAVVKEISPKTVTILGGHGCSSNEELANLPHLDIAVFGEAEQSLPQIMEVIKKGGSLGDVRGIAYKNEDGELCRNPLAELIDLKRDYALPDWGSSCHRANECYFLETSRGCSYRCRFCQYYKMFDGKVRYRNIVDIVTELKRNYELYGIHRYRLNDPSFNVPTKRCIELCNLIAKEKLDITFSCYARADHITPEVAQALKSAGCYNLFFGIESGDSRMLEKMQKGTNIEKISEGISFSNAAGLFTHGNFVVGFPGETEESVENTRAFVRYSTLDTVYYALFWLNNRCDVNLNREHYNIVGSGVDWKHDTMTSAQAQEHIKRLILDLAISGGPTLGSELFFPFFMILGFEVDEIMQFMKQLWLLRKIDLLSEYDGDIGKSSSKEESLQSHKSVADFRAKIYTRTAEYWDQDPLLSCRDDGK
jgi:anaerobic magnesium-protoporphyrin IX monomethyl ester cyclase